MGNEYGVWPLRLMDFAEWATEGLGSDDARHERLRSVAVDAVSDPASDKLYLRALGLEDRGDAPELQPFIQSEDELDSALLFAAALTPFLDRGADLPRLLPLPAMVSTVEGGVARGWPDLLPDGHGLASLADGVSPVLGVDAAAFPGPGGWLSALECASLLEFLNGHSDWPARWTDQMVRTWRSPTMAAAVLPAPDPTEDDLAPDRALFVQQLAEFQRLLVLGSEPRMGLRLFASP